MHKLYILSITDNIVRIDIIGSDNMEDESYLVDKEKEVLRKLALEGLKTGYDLHSSKEKIMSSSTWHYLRNSLIKKGLIEIKKEETFEIRGRKRKFYGLTLLGLCVVLSEEMKKSLYNHKELLNKIAENWKDIVPSILGKWNIFVKNGLEREATFSLLVSASLIKGVFDLLSTIKDQDEEEVRDNELAFALGFQYLRNPYLFDPQKAFEFYFYNFLLESINPLIYTLFKELDDYGIVSFDEKAVLEERERRLNKLRECIKEDPSIQGYILNCLERKISKLEVELKECLNVKKDLLGQNGGKNGNLCMQR
ncbi:MAG: hypothetical protein QXX94_07550 [Candidatus Bathyarchaeia archaeon]